MDAALDVAVSHVEAAPLAEDVALNAISSAAVTANRDVTAKAARLAGPRKDNNGTLVRAAAAARVRVAMPVGAADARPGENTVNGVEANDRVAKLAAVNGAKPGVENDKAAIGEMRTDARCTLATVAVAQVLEVGVQVAPAR